MMSARHDKVIQATDLDALSSKHSAYEKGYINDEYIPVFVQAVKQENSRTSFTPKLPLINRGTYIRCHAIDVLIEKFLRHTSPGKRQIISFGAGSDTRPFHLLVNHQNLVYHELDFGASTSRKCRIVRGDERLRRAINFSEDQPGNERDEIHTLNYHLHQIDLRKMDTTQLLQGMDSSVPTLILSECCLCYLAPEKSDGLLGWVGNLFAKPSVIIYEAIGLDDQFGQVMIENLASRGISLPTLMKYPTLESQKKRLETYLTYCSSCDFDTIHREWLSSQDTDRINSLEFLDEREELDLLLKHYCIAYGSVDEETFGVY